VLSKTHDETVLKAHIFRSTQNHENSISMYVNGFQKPGTLIRDISKASSELPFAVHVSIFSVTLKYNIHYETEDTIKLVIFYVAISIQMDLEIMKLNTLTPNRLRSLILMVSNDGV
jgi:hypothetical protein